MNKLKQYYKLCSIKDKKYKTVPLINQLEQSAVDVIFTKNNVELYFKEKDGIYKIKEDVIGAHQKKNMYPTLVF